MFSIDQTLATPPLSALISIYLIAGFDLIGVFLLRRIGFTIGSHRDWVRWQAPIMGAMLIALVLYPLALLNLTSLLFMQLIASIFIVAGSFQIYRTVRWCYLRRMEIKSNLKMILEWSFPKKMLIFILFGMALVALGPATSADALDNHLGVAIAILNNGGFPVMPEWFHSRLTGNGEVLNAIGMSVGAEQFGSLLQFVSLLGVAGIILYASDVNGKSDTYQKKFPSELIALASFSAPVLLFLVSSAKPQMWPIAMTTFAFALIVHPSRRNLSRSNALIGYFLVCLLVMTAAEAKFNFMLGGCVVGVFAFIFMAKQRYFLAALGITLITATLVMLPSIIWKASTFDTTLIDALISPLPGHLPGTVQMIAISQFNPDTSSIFHFPFNILIPSNIGSFGVVLGVGWLVLIGLRPGRDLRFWFGICAAVIVLITNVMFAPPAARMYLEPYFWLLIILALQPNNSMLSQNTWVKWPIIFQSFLMLIAAWFGAFLLFPGALLLDWRTNIMLRSANGYEVMQWADTVLPKNAVLLNGHRSMALSPRDAVSSQWTQYVDINSESKIYLDRLKFRKVSHILVTGAVDYSSPIASCYGKIVAGPAVGHLATRNPFNQGPSYETWILEFESARLPDCALQGGHAKR